MKPSRLVLLVAVLMVAMTGGCIVSSSDSSLTIANESSYAIVEINLTPTDSVTWGPNLLGSEWLYPGQEITIDFIDCDYYDVRLVDDTYAECVIENVDFCFDNDMWVITDTFLDDCIFG
jgi:hypothetical protein